MGVRRRRSYRRWPIWLLLAALLLLVLGVLLMHRSYRAQLDASMVRLQQSVATARAQQARLAASIRAARAAVGDPASSQFDDQAGDQTDIRNPARREHLTNADEPGVATRLQAVAADLERLALSAVPVRSEAASDHRNGADQWLDWRQVRKAARELVHAVRQHLMISRHRTAPLGNAQQQAARDWLQRVRSAVGQANAPALIQALAAIERLLAADARDDPAADQLAQRAARLRSVLTASPLSESERRRLIRLAEEISVIAQQLERGPNANRRSQ